MDKLTSNLKPKQTWIDERFQEVCKAIAGRYESLQPIPEEWITEYNELLSKVSKSNQ
jgi:hypothetical protein